MRLSCCDALRFATTKSDYINVWDGWKFLREWEFLKLWSSAPRLMNIITVS